MPMKPAPPLDEPRTATSAVSTSGWVLRGVEAGFLGVAAIFFALHFVHLRADLPNHLPWMDWAKYTDEGWYGDGAIRHYQWGHWDVPGDFNLAAAMPAWSLLEAAVFRFTGVSVTAARALAVASFGLSLVCCYLLAVRWPNVQGGLASGGRTKSLVPAAAVLLLAANPLCYVFSRLAIAEPLLLLLMLVTLLAATAAGRSAGLMEAASAERQSRMQRWAWTGVLGVLLPMMVLTKTTAVFLFPAIFWLLWAATDYRPRPFFRVASGATVVGAVVWLAYFLCLIRLHLLADYQYVFRMNRDRILTPDNFCAVVLNALLEGRWLGKPLYALALVAAGVSLAGLLKGRPKTHPLAVVFLLWIVGYTAFMVYHAAVCPRYYLELTVPTTLLVLFVFEPLLLRALRSAAAGGRRKDGVVAGPERGLSTRIDELLPRLAAIVVAVALTAGFWLDARATLGFVRHPEYTWVSAAEGIRQTVERERAVHPGHSRLVLSISGSDLSLMTGLPSICDEFGTMSLQDRVAKYQPGWYATWNDVDVDTMEALALRYRLVRVAAFPAFDDPKRNLLVLYRLDALEPPVRAAALRHLGGERVIAMGSGLRGMR